MRVTQNNSGVRLHFLRDEIEGQSDFVANPPGPQQLCQSESNCQLMHTEGSASRPSMREFSTVHRSATHVCMAILHDSCGHRALSWVAGVRCARAGVHHCAGEKERYLLRRSHGSVPTMFPILLQVHLQKDSRDESAYTPLEHGSPRSRIHHEVKQVFEGLHERPSISRNCLVPRTFFVMYGLECTHFS